MAGLFKPPESLTISDSVAHDWVIFKEQFKLFLIATESESKKEEIKIAQLLNVIGREALAIFHTFKLGPIESLKLEDVFKEFAKEWGFEVINTSPLYPRSNEQVERTVQTVKKMLKKCLDCNQDFQSALLEYRNTPVVKGLSPAQILMSRRLRTRVPISKKLLQPSLYNPDDVKQAIVTKQVKSAHYYNQKTKPKAEFKVMDPVYVYNLGKNIWEPGQIIAFAGTPRSYLVKMSSGRVLRRNSFYVRSRRNDQKWDECPQGNLTRVYYDVEPVQSSPNRSVVDTPRQESCSGSPVRPSPHKIQQGTPRSHESPTLSRHVSPNVSCQSPTSSSPKATESNVYKTRFGRVNRLPQKLKDYETN